MRRKKEKWFVIGFANGNVWVRDFMRRAEAEQYRERALEENEIKNDSEDIYLARTVEEL